MTEMDSETSGVRFPPPLVFLGLGLLGWAIEQVLALDIALLPGRVAWLLAAALGLVGMILIAGAVYRFREAGTPPEPWRPTSAITRKGVYRRTRNPMYLGMTCLLAAAAVGFQSVGILLGTALALLAIDRLVVRREEAYLLRRFGDEYADYQASVPRWL